jgi:hypothetical protein
MFHVSGGLDEAWIGMTDILAWDAVSETWSLAGHRATARSYTGITKVSLATFTTLCPASK